MRKGFWIAAPAVFLLLLPLGAYAQQTQAASSVAEAARKARERKKSAPKAAKVFTNDNIPAIAGDVSVVGKPAPAPEGEAAAAPGAKPAAAETAEKPQEKGEAYWRERFGKIRTKLHQAETELDVMQRELNGLEVQYYPDPQKALMQSVLRSDIDAKRAKIDAKQKEIDQLKQQLSDMEDELRKSGGDPGWAGE